MRSRIAALFVKHREVIMYVIFGVMTTGVNWAAYYVLTRWAGLDVTPAAVLAWTLSVLFAYVTNRKWVFESAAAGFAGIAKELGMFALARVFTGVLDIVLLNVAVSVGINDAIAKLATNVIVIILNFVLSKVFVFKR